MRHAATATSPLVNAGTLWAGVGLVAFGALRHGRRLDAQVDESDALATASAQVGFPVGHASAQMAWRGLAVAAHLAHPAVLRRRTRPRGGASCWSTASSGEVIEWFVEDNPEDWADLDGRSRPDRAGACLRSPRPCTAGASLSPCHGTVC